MNKAEARAIRAIAALCKAEGISMCNPEVVIASLSETAMPTQLTRIYNKWLADGEQIMNEIASDEKMIAKCGKQQDAMELGE